MKAKSVSFLLHTNGRIIENLKNNPRVIKKLDSFDLYQIILLSFKDEEFNEFLNVNKKYVLEAITTDFTFFDGLSLLLLLKKDNCKDEARKIFEQSMKQVFNSKTIMFMSKINEESLENNCYNKQYIISHVFSELASFDSLKSSIIIYNLNNFNDFRTELKIRYSVIEQLLSAYQKFDLEVMSNNSFKGSTILGFLLKEDNQYLVKDYIDNLLKECAFAPKVECIGAGSTCLVYKIGNKVIKLGEDRNSRKIYVNHRILASQVRKLLKKGDKPLFYVEIMNYLKDTNVTKEECEELRLDLLRQGLIWEDAKPENCGLLNDGDPNFSYLPVDYEEVVQIVDNPIAREEFMKQKRKVVVLDNDCIRPNPKLNWK